jgi:hypothetical protein
MREAASWSVSHWVIRCRVTVEVLHYGRDINLTILLVMKHLLMIAALFVSLGCWGQREKPISVRMTGQYDFGVRGMGMNDGGMGVDAALSLFAKKRMQLLTEAHSHLYIGDKSFVIDSDGKELPNGSLHSLQMGPQVFLSKTLALSAIYGLAWHRHHQWSYSLDDGYRLALTGYFGDQNNFITQLSWMQVLGEEGNIRHFGIGVGYRLL